MAGEEAIRYPGIGFSVASIAGRCYDERYRRSNSTASANRESVSCSRNAVCGSCQFAHFLLVRGTGESEGVVIPLNLLRGYTDPLGTPLVAPTHFREHQFCATMMAASTKYGSLRGAPGRTTPVRQGMPADETIRTVDRTPRLDGRRTAARRRRTSR